jgi:glycosyltransferase involved in cell wall biosynthesis
VTGWVSGPLDPAVAERARCALDTASAVVFNSNAALRVHANVGARDRVIVIPTGVDVRGARDYRAGADRDGTRRALGIPAGARLLIGIGKLWPLKGQAVLAQAMRHAAPANLVCVLAGEPTEPYAGALSRLIVDRGLQGSIRLLPFLDDVRPWLAAADVAVCVSDTESMPATVLEAMAFGLPVLASRVGDVPELVEPGVTGWLVEPSDLGSLCEGLERVSDATADDLRALGTAASLRVAERHDRDVTLHRIVQLIRNLAG